MFFNKYKDRCDQLGLSADDLYQESFFAIEKAVRKYRPEKNVKFLTYAGWPLKAQFFCVAKMHSTGWQNNNVYSAISLDEENNEPETRLLDCVSDETAETEIETVIVKDYTDNLRRDLDEAMSALTSHQAKILKKRYYEDLRPAEIARELHIKRASLTRPFQQALETLKANQKLSQYQLN